MPAAVLMEKRRQNRRTKAASLCFVHCNIETCVLLCMGDCTAVGVLALSCTTDDFCVKRNSREKTQSPCHLLSLLVPLGGMGWQYSPHAAMAGS